MFVGRAAVEQEHLSWVCLPEQALGFGGGEFEWRVGHRVVPFQRERVPQAL
jgi:hypothetical protein